MISAALEKLERIAHENRMLAMNARIEAAHAGWVGRFSCLGMPTSATENRGKHHGSRTISR